MFKINNEHLLRVTLFVNIMGDMIGKSAGIISPADLNIEARKSAWEQACKITKSATNKDWGKRR